MSRLNSLGNSPYAFWTGSLHWLPVGIMLTAVFRFPDQLASPTGWLMLLGGLASLIFVAPCGLPLALACRRLWLFGHREGAWATMVGLAARGKSRASTETGEAPARQGARSANIGNIQATSNAAGRDASSVECRGTFATGC